MTYEIEVCPFCGAQVGYDGGYDGYGYVFDCEHESFSQEYGSVEPIKVPVTPRGLKAMLALAAPKLEEQKRKKAARDAELAAKEKARWDALTPEQRERELARQKLFADVTREMAQAMMRQVFAPSPLSDAGRVAKIPVFKQSQDGDSE